VLSAAIQRLEMVKGRRKRTPWFYRSRCSDHAAGPNVLPMFAVWEGLAPAVLRVQNEAGAKGSPKGVARPFWLTRHDGRLSGFLTSAFKAFSETDLDEDLKGRRCRR